MKQTDQKRMIAWLLIILVPLLVGVFVSSLFRFGESRMWIAIIEKNFAATVGLPMAAIGSAFLVVALRQRGGPVKFKGLGFEFEGTSGEVVLWVLCFLSMTAAIRLLWGIG